VVVHLRGMSLESLEQRLLRRAALSSRHPLTGNPAAGSVIATVRVQGESFPCMRPVGSTPTLRERFVFCP
jgi:hypothetical protein